jgi:hypothetical protein
MNRLLKLNVFYYIYGFDNIYIDYNLGFKYSLTYIQTGNDFITIEYIVTVLASCHCYTCYYTYITVGIDIVELRVGRSLAALLAASSSGLDSKRFAVQRCIVAAVGSCFVRSSFELGVVEPESFACFQI